MFLCFHILLQKDVVEAECWVAQVRRREWGEERHQERVRVWEEELEWREVEGDALRGRSEVITQVHNEQREVAQHHVAVLQGKYFPLPPQIIATIWLSLPQVQICQFTFGSCWLCTLGGDSNKICHASYIQGTCCPIITHWQTIPCQ